MCSHKPRTLTNLTLMQTGRQIYRLPLLRLMLGATLLVSHCQAASIWIEGEDAAEKSVTKHSWYDAVNKEGLSGGEWLSHYDKKPGTAAYRFEAPEAGHYAFWWRGNVSMAKVSYR